MSDGKLTVCIEPLDRAHDRGAFSCEEDRLTNFLKVNSRRDNEAYKVRVFVACEPESKKVLGFYSLVLTALVPEEVSEEAREKFGRVKATPAIYLAMIARDGSMLRRGVGEQLMEDAFNRALLISEHAGAYAVALDALNERVAQIYEGYGFERFIEGELKMFIPLKTLRIAQQA